MMSDAWWTDVRTVTRITFLVSPLCLILTVGCGGGTGTSPPPPSTSPTPSTPNPCTAALAEVSGVRQVVGERKVVGPDVHGPSRALGALWAHEAAARRGQIRTALPQPQSEDVGDVAVLQDEGDLVLPPNRFDLAGDGLRFTPNGSGGYDVAAVDGTFRQALGSKLSLGDDDGVEEGLPFAFDFYGHWWNAVFVNSDGNLTFQEADRSSTDRDIGRLLSGPPRLAPFLADLDPTSGGAVFAEAASDGLTVTWCAVPGFDKPQTTTAQITLLSDGSVEIKYAPTLTLTDAVVGLSPGKTATFAPLDLTAGGSSTAADAALGERFAAFNTLDTVALSRKFFATHPDGYDQIVVFTDASYVQDAFAYEMTVANEIQGIGMDLYDLAADYGSAGRLRSLVVMDALTKYPADPAQKFLGENDTVSVLGQEVGHRWLAFLRFLDKDRQASDALLGRDQAHWSFFMDSDASVMEGNDIQALGGGAFRTVAAVQRYCLLDQYAMGLVDASEVPPFFYVESPVNVQPPEGPTSAPKVGVTFNGTRRDVLIQDVVDVMGPRVPAAADSPRVHGQAFVYLVSAGRTADSSAVAKVDRIRQAWEAFFLQATDGRMRAETRLLPPG